MKWTFSSISSLSVRTDCSSILRCLRSDLYTINKVCPKYPMTGQFIALYFKVSLQITGLLHSKNFQGSIYVKMIEFIIVGRSRKMSLNSSTSYFSYLLDVIFHSKSYILLKTPLKSDMSFQSYYLLKGCQNNRKQKDLFPLFSSISKSIFANSNSFCLMIPQLSI